VTVAVTVGAAAAINCYGILLQHYCLLIVVGNGLRTMFIA
jgi:hypothetical protein